MVLAAERSAARFQALRRPSGDSAKGGDSATAGYVMPWVVHSSSMVRPAAPLAPPPRKQLAADIGAAHARRRRENWRVRPGGDESLYSADADAATRLAASRYPRQYLIPSPPGVDAAVPRSPTHACTCPPSQPSLYVAMAQFTSTSLSSSQPPPIHTSTSTHAPLAPPGQSAIANGHLFLGGATQVLRAGAAPRALRPRLRHAGGRAGGGDGCR
jgi:hypothetical protein